MGGKLAENCGGGHRHCEERSDEAIQNSLAAFASRLDCFAALGMTETALAPATILAHSGRMAQPHEMPVMEPFPDKDGTGWHVIIRYHEGPERRIEGFASKAEAVDWIEANATQVKE